MQYKHPPHCGASHPETIRSTQLAALEAPEVAYTDWKHFVDVVYDTKACFVQAMEAAVQADAAVYVAHRASTTPATTLHSFRDPIYHDAAMCHFEGEARQIMARLALGNACAWTRCAATELCERVTRVSRIYRDVIVYHHAYDFTHDDDTLVVNQFGNAFPHLFEFKAQHMCALMKQEVELAFGGQCPWNRQSFQQSLVAHLLTHNFHVLDRPPYIVLSTQELHAMRLAFAQGSHARLGAESHVLGLDCELCALVFSFVLLPQYKTMKNFHSAAQWLF